MLDVIVAETSDAAQLLKPLAFGLMDRTGKVMGRPHLESFRGREIRVEVDRPVALEVDGDVIPGLVAADDARALPGAARIVVVDSNGPLRERRRRPEPLRGLRRHRLSRRIAPSRGSGLAQAERDERGVGGHAGERAPDERARPSRH